MFLEWLHMGRRRGMTSCRCTRPCWTIRAPSPRCRPQDGGLTKVVLARRTDVAISGRLDPLCLLEALGERDPRAYQIMLQARLCLIDENRRAALCRRCVSVHVDWAATSPHAARLSSLCNPADALWGHLSGLHARVPLHAHRVGRCIGGCGRHTRPRRRCARSAAAVRSLSRPCTLCLGHPKHPTVKYLRRCWSHGVTVVHLCKRRRRLRCSPLLVPCRRRRGARLLAGL